MNNGNGNHSNLHEILLAHIRRRKAKLKQELVELEAAEKAIETTLAYESHALDRIKSELDMRPLLPDETQDKSQRAILHLIARRNDGWLFVQSAIKLMIDAGILTEDTASAQVYTLLRQNRDEFTQVKPGIYYLSDTERQITESLQKTETRIRLVDKVASLRIEHPTWTPKEVCKELVRSEWDFGNKKPIFCVTMAYAYLAKRKKAQKKER